VRTRVPGRQVGGRRRWGAAAILAATAVVVASCGDERAGPTPTTTPPDDVPSAPRNVKVAEGGRWVETDCQIMPDDSFWHADVRNLPTAEPYTPDGSGLEGFPRTRELNFGINMGSGSGPTPNWVDSSDPLQWVRTTSGFAQNSDYTRVEVVGSGPFRRVTNGALRHRVSNPILTEKSSTDDHALFLDTELCTAVEYIGWSRIPGRLEGRNGTVMDLESNARRISSEDGWYEAANNGPGDKPIDSPFTPVDRTTQGMGGIDMRGARGAVTSSSGSGLAIIPGIPRLYEVFETPLPGDQSVAPDARIDHALIGVFPTWHVQSIPSAPDPSGPRPFVWPATRTDGCAGGRCVGDVAGQTGSEYSIPMGSRLRLKNEKCAADWKEPQARIIVDALCEHGIVITDTSAGFGATVERSDSRVGSKWSADADRELSQLSVHDFELVDTGSIAVVDPDALWDSAVTWARARYGAGRPIQQGWYTGTFWGALLGCERPQANGTRNCSDRVLSEADAAANSPDWYRVDQ
jgi:hypothetical protein